MRKVQFDIINGVQPKKPAITMDDAPMVLAEIQASTTTSDTELHPAVLSYYLANKGRMSKETAQVAEKSAKELNPELWEFGIRVAKLLKRRHDDSLEEVQEEVKKHLLGELAEICFVEALYGDATWQAY